MKFALLVAILAETLEEKAIDIARRAGAGGVTLLDARGVGATEKKTFVGLTYEGSQTVLICVLGRKLSLAVMNEGLDPGTGSREAVPWGRFHNSAASHCRH